MGRESVEGRVALITGASSGIGLATARTFVEAGIKVALVARRTDKLRDLREEIVSGGGIAEIYTADVGDESQAYAACEWAQATFGHIDILINNAGIIRPGSVADQNPQEWRDTIDVNLLGPVYMSQGVIPAMKARQRGHIINISSNAAKNPGAPEQSAYFASKYGITALSSSLRKELSGDGVRVTIIEPGATETDVADSVPDEAIRQSLAEHVGKDTSMRADDVAEAILYAVCQPQRVNINEIWLTPTHH